MRVSRAGGGTGGPVRVTRTPEAYGALKNGVADDTTAVQGAIDAAVTACIADSSFYCEVWLSGHYRIAGALVQGGATKGNSQLTFPVRVTTAHKITLVLKGMGEAGALPHWEQTVTQRAGAVLETTLTGQAYSATYGLPSVLGGPTPEQGYATTGALFTNICVVIDGVMIVAPANPSVCGVNLAGVAECNVSNLGCQADQVPSTALTVQTNFMTGLIMPYNGNNAYCEIGMYSCEGWRNGVLLGEHSNVQSLRCVLCQTGVRIGGPNRHGIVVQHACVEACVKHLEYIDLGTVAFSAAGSYVWIGAMDTEGGAGNFTTTDTIVDSSNNLFGDINVMPNAGNDTITVTGGGNVKVIRLDSARGTITAPAVPVSTVAYRNTTWRDAAVTVTAGTVTVIAVDAVATGLTAGTVLVPSGKTVTLTYSVAPTWKWTLL